jgi:hypothetical protein
MTHRARELYDLFRDAQLALEIPFSDLYATKDSYLSPALTSGVDLRRLSEQTGVHERTLLCHYGGFVHKTDADARELGKNRPRVPRRRCPYRQLGHVWTPSVPKIFPLWIRSVPDGICTLLFSPFHVVAIVKRAA